MKKITFTLLSMFIFQFTFSQSAAQLNDSAKTLIQQGKFKEAFPLAQHSAAMGNPEAQYNYGLFLQEGMLGNKDEEESIKWFLKSSDSGFNDAHYALMMAYANGNGVTQNAEKAFSYALKCAHNKDATCMWNVANCYLTGNGTPADTTKFKEWIVQLAMLPNPENIALSVNITSARLEIAHFYKNGLYFDQDNYLSYLWYLIYNEGKRDLSIFQQEEVIEQIKAVEKSLTAAQLESAPKEAEALLGRQLLRINERYNKTL